MIETVGGGGGEAVGEPGKGTLNGVGSGGGAVAPGGRGVAEGADGVGAEGAGAGAGAGADVRAGVGTGRAAGGGLGRGVAGGGGAGVPKPGGRIDSGAAKTAAGTPTPISAAVSSAAFRLWPSATDQIVRHVLLDRPDRALVGQELQHDDRDHDDR